MYSGFRREIRETGDRSHVALESGTRIRMCACTERLSRVQKAVKIAAYPVHPCEGEIQLNDFKCMLEEWSCTALAAARFLHPPQVQD